MGGDAFAELEAALEHARSCAEAAEARACDADAALGGARAAAAAAQERGKCAEAAAAKQLRGAEEQVPLWLLYSMRKPGAMATARVIWSMASERAC